MTKQTQSEKPTGGWAKIDKTTAECVKLVGQTSAGCIDFSKKCFHSRKLKKCFVILSIIFILACMSFGETVLKKLSGNGPIWPELSNGIKNVVFCDGIVFAVSAWLFIIITSGAIGGMINHAYLNLKIFKDESIFKDKKDKHDEHYSLLNFMLIGAGGALCVAWFKIAIMSQEEYPGALETRNIFIILTWSFVAGLFAFPLIELIQKKFIAAMSKDEITNIVDSKVGNVEKEVEDSVTYNRLLSFADTAFSTKSPTHIQDAIDKILENIDKFHFDRTLNIYLARLYKAQEKYDKAIDSLKSFISKLDKRNTAIHILNNSEKEAYAAAYFNICCYYCLKAEKETNNKDKLLGMAITALKNVEKYSPQVVETALEDPELKILEKLYRENFGNYS